MEKLGRPPYGRSPRFAFVCRDGLEPPFRSAMTNPRDEARAIFGRAVEHTRVLSPATFDQWFGGVQFDDLTDGVLSLRAQNEFVLEWVKTNFLPTLTDKIRELTGWSVQVAWTVDQNLDAPIAPTGGRAPVPPVRPRPIVVRPSSPPGPSRTRPSGAYDRGLPLLLRTPRRPAGDDARAPELLHGGGAPGRAPRRAGAGRHQPEAHLRELRRRALATSSRTPRRSRRPAGAAAATTRSSSAAARASARRT